MVQESEPQEAVPDSIAAALNTRPEMDPMGYVFVFLVIAIPVAIIIFVIFLIYKSPTQDARIRRVVGAVTPFLCLVIAVTADYDEEAALQLLLSSQSLLGSILAAFFGGAIGVGIIEWFRYLSQKDNEGLKAFYVFFLSAVVALIIYTGRVGFVPTLHSFLFGFFLFSCFDIMPRGIKNLVSDKDKGDDRDQPSLLGKFSWLRKAKQEKVSREGKGSAEKPHSPPKSGKPETDKKEPMQSGRPASD